MLQFFTLQFIRREAMQQRDARQDVSKALDADVFFWKHFLKQPLCGEPGKAPEK